MELKNVIESILFTSQKPLNVRELRDILSLSAEKGEEPAVKAFKKVKEEELEKALAELEQEHAQLGRSYYLACVAGAWQFVTRPEYMPWLRTLFGVKTRPPRLSQPALETLAIVAYRQPITRAEVEQIRGVAVDGVVATLLERGLIENAGRAEVVGRPMTYATTALFLEYFGLRNLDELPSADELRRIPVQKPESLLTVEGSAAASPSAEGGTATPNAEGQTISPGTETEPSGKSPESGESGGPGPSTEPELPAETMSLQKHREAIDRLDKQIVALLNERTKHVLEIGDIKIKAGEEIYAPHRELAVLERLCKLNEGPITNESLRAIYREIMSSALSLEKTMTVAYFGPEATFTHQAAIRKFGSSLNYSAHKTIADVFVEVSKGRADYGVVPIENSTEGVVTHTLDMFVDSDLKIVAQIILPIQQCLMANCKLEEIKKIYSHPQPIAQCREYLQTRLHHVEIVETSSTTRAAEIASGEKNAAAIAGALAAERYGLKILEKDIQDSSSNATRFFVLGRQCSPATGKDRTSLMLSIAHEVGALHKALSIFSRNKLNMTRIESRPNKRKAWEYFFFVDCDGHFEDKKVSDALDQLHKTCNFVKVLGSYPNAE